MYLQQVITNKIRKLNFSAFLKIADEKSRIRIRTNPYGSATRVSDRRIVEKT
jgi:hypothetical protein